MLVVECPPTSVPSHLVVTFKGKGDLSDEVTERVVQWGNDSTLPGEPSATTESL